MEKKILLQASALVLISFFFATYLQHSDDKQLTGQLVTRQHDGQELRCIDCTGIWISRAKIMQLSPSGLAWNNLLTEANQPSCIPNLADQNDNCNVRILAKSLVSVRLGIATPYRDDVVSALRSIVNSGTYIGRALALGRELGTYVIAADIIDLQTVDSALDAQFRAKLLELQITFTSGGPKNLFACHDDRPNNWGTHCGVTRLAIAAYLHDQQEITRSAQVFKGWLGDLNSYNGFTYGDLSWQCNSPNPVGINPSGCTKQFGGFARNLDGVIPDDQRRSGSFTWPPSKENYVWESLQGAVVQAELLSRLGYDAWNWENQALQRAMQWLHLPHFLPSGAEPYPATGDDTWIPWLVNKRYRTSFPATSPTTAGKNIGWTDWTHQ